MSKKFVEASRRIFKNIFVCRNCKSKLRGNIMKILAGKTKCRRCNGKALRTLRKKGNK